MKSNRFQVPIIWAIVICLLVLAQFNSQNYWSVLTIVAGGVFGICFPYLLNRLAPKIASLLFSYPILFSLGAITLYLVTSNMRSFGVSLTLSLGLYLVADLYCSRQDLDALRKKWFSVFPAQLSDAELKIFIWGACGTWLSLVLFSLLIKTI